MAWEVAKGILIAAAIIPLAIGLIGLLCAISAAILKGFIEVSKRFTADLQRPATLKLTGNSKGWVLPFTNRQAALFVVSLCLVIAVLAFISQHLAP